MFNEKELNMFNEKDMLFTEVRRDVGSCDNIPVYAVELYVGGVMALAFNGKQFSDASGGLVHPNSNLPAVKVLRHHHAEWKASCPHLDFDKIFKEIDKASDKT